MTTSDIAALERICPGGVSVGEELSQLSQWKIGGRADLILRPSSAREVAALCTYFSDLGVTPLVIGSTTNLLFSDDGLRVPCIQIGGRMAALTIDGVDIRAGAGYWVPFLARKLMQAGLTGLEHICGIPGTLGGLICMNGGSQRKGVGSHIMTVESVDRDANIRTRASDALEFSYRHSVFHEVDEIITAAHIRLAPGDRGNIRREMLEILGSRRRKFPRKEPNCGSTFVSDPSLYADYGPPGAIIERLGFKGYRVGGAQVSPVHANFVVNDQKASARDVLTIIRDINVAVERETGQALLAEVRHVLTDGTSLPASAVAAEMGRDCP